MARLVLTLRLLLAVCTAVGTVAPVQAAAPERPQARVPRDGVSLGQAVAQAKARTGGRVLAAERGQVNGEPVYRIKVLTPRGRVLVLVMDARTGNWRH